MESDKKIHELSGIFPLDESHIPELAEDIKNNGLISPIELLDGKILDGRRRFKACKLVGVEPRFIKVSPTDPIAYVLSTNLHRRHLDASQRAMVAAKVENLYAKQAKERQKLSKGRGQKGPATLPEVIPDSPIPQPKGDARDLVGKDFGVGGRTVTKAKKVLKKGIPILIESVEKGVITVSSAETISNATPEVQKNIVENRLQGKTVKNKPVESNGKSDVVTTRVRPSVAIERANEAINSLTRIPRNDPQRNDAFQLVSDWVKRNRRLTDG